MVPVIAPFSMGIFLLFGYVKAEGWVLDRCNNIIASELIYEVKNTDPMSCLDTSITFLKDNPNRIAENTYCIELEGKDCFVYAYKKVTTTTGMEPKIQKFNISGEDVKELINDYDKKTKFLMKHYGTQPVIVDMNISLKKQEAELSAPSLATGDEPKGDVAKVESEYKTVRGEEPVASLPQTIGSNKIIEFAENAVKLQTLESTPLKENMKTISEFNGLPRSFGPSVGPDVGDDTVETVKTNENTNAKLIAPAETVEINEKTETTLPKTRPRKKTMIPKVEKKQKKTIRNSFETTGKQNFFTKTADKVIKKMKKKNFQDNGSANAPAGDEPGRKQRRKI